MLCETVCSAAWWAAIAPRSSEALIVAPRLQLGSVIGCKVPGRIRQNRSPTSCAAQAHSVPPRPRGTQVTAVASRSHLNQATVDYLEEAVGTCDFVAVGSSLKFCIVAEGAADIYPRASPTSEWDTAAGHAVLLAAGGLVHGPDGGPLRYGKRAFLNRAFVATSGWEPPRLDRYLEPFSGGGDVPLGV
jgi:3'-phosphoadenosine 5'-phosphosulfate (PAPS) 3'-phosphatase